ncbi:MAG: DUF6273 domain-containing protein [Aristaeellaceae bacterium]
MDRMHKRWLCAVITAVMLCAICGTAIAATRPIGPSSAPQGDFRTVGSIVTFGSYEQDNYTGNGKEGIEWIVLDYEPNGDYALLISRYCLDAHYFNRETYNAWSDSDIRSWLNDTFYAAAFSSSERNAVMMAEVETVRANGRLETTQDRVFLLSKEEAMRFFPGRTWNESEEVAARRAVPTAYAVANGAYQSSKTFVDGRGTTCWWLRSYYGDNGKTGAAYREYANGVRESGSIFGYSLKTYNTNKWYGVRPVIWISVREAESAGN